MDAEYLDAYLSDELDEATRERVEHALLNDSALRASFIDQAQMAAALEVLLEPEDSPRDEAFRSGVLARLRSEGAGERSFAKSVLLEIVEEREGQRPIRWPDLVKTGLISAAASIGLLLLLQSIIFRQGTSTQGVAAMPAHSIAYVARIEHGEGLKWDAATQKEIRSDGWLAPGLLRLEAGTALIAFNSGASTLVEGPAELSIESGNRLFLKSGRLTAEVPRRAVGFTVNTPRLNAVDIGTRFGVAVESDGTSELHVMQGLVDVSRTSGNSVVTRLREGLAVRADSRTRSDLIPISYRGEEFQLQRVPTTPVRPALRFDFDESAGAILEDSGSEQRYDVPLVATGELDQSPRRSIGRVGGGLVFQPGETLDIPLSQDFRLDEAHTIGFWVKLPAKIENRSKETLLTYGQDEFAWSISCHLNPEHGIRGALCIESGGGQLIGGTDLADGNWHHVAYRYLGGKDFVSSVQVFVDGKPETISYSQRGRRPVGLAKNLRLGGSLSSGFHGWIDDLCLFREAIPTVNLQRLSD